MSCTGTELWLARCTLVNCLSACHDLVSGWLYPPCNWLEMSPDMLTLVAAVLAYERA